MREICSIQELRRRGVTRTELSRNWRLVQRGIYAEGWTDITPLDDALATLMATNGVASGRLAGSLLGLDGVSVERPDVTVAPGANRGRPGVRRRALGLADIVDVHGFRCTSGLRTVIDLAGELNDRRWEHALEAALRKRLTRVAEIEAELPALGRSRIAGVTRIKRVLALRPLGAPATESLLETLMVQLARRVEGLPAPERQHVVLDIARVDLAWPQLGMFVELDGQQHKDQPVYDARRETAVVEATGWLCGRFTWHEVVHLPRTTARRLGGVADQARRRIPR